MDAAAKREDDPQKTSGRTKLKAQKNVLKEASRIVPVSLRVPLDFLHRIDRVVQARKKRKNVPLPRHSWIMEAMAEKVEREAQEFGVIY